MRRKTKFIQKSRANIFWFVIFLMLPLLPWWLLTSVAIPDFWDTQYVMKSRCLKDCVKKLPGHPLWVVMGSSRVEHGLCPRVLEARMKQQGAPVIYNFGQGGADLFRQFISLRRVIKDGIKPDRVGIEMMSVLLGNKRSVFADDASLVVRARRDELEDYYEYSTVPTEARLYWYQSRLAPTFKYGTTVPLQAIYLHFPGFPFIRYFGTPPPYDQWGWHVTAPYEKLPEAAQAKIDDEARNPYRDLFKEKFEVQPLQKKLVLRMLELCRKNKIDVFLVRMPEGKVFQEIYPAAANTAVDTYIGELSRENHLPFIDARDWIGAKGFYDGHHMNSNGAEEFTRRFGDVMFNSPPSATP